VPTTGRTIGRSEAGARSLIILLVLSGLALSFACQKPRPTYHVEAAREGYTHVIVEGETLESIAEKYYGEPSLGKALGEYNNIDVLKTLEPGVTLLVPFDASGLVEITRRNEGYVAYNRGTMLARTGQYEEALPYLEKAVAADPGNSDAWHNLAVTYQRLGRTDEALPVLERLTGSVSSEKTYLYSYGSVLRTVDRKKDALKAFKKAIEIDPEYREAQYALAVTLEDLGRLKQARREWGRYLEIDPDSVWSEEARIHFKNLGGQ
jgi:tetratricopeptide (TPR) repeat protein